MAPQDSRSAGQMVRRASSRFENSDWRVLVHNVWTNGAASTDSTRRTFPPMSTRSRSVRSVGTRSESSGVTATRPGSTRSDNCGSFQTAPIDCGAIPLPTNQPTAFDHKTDIVESNRVAVALALIDQHGSEENCGRISVPTPCYFRLAAAATAPQIGPIRVNASCDANSVTLEA